MSWVPFTPPPKRTPSPPTIHLPRQPPPFSLENRQQQLALSMEERKQEIAVHQDVQRAQLRAAEEEKHRITVELGGRRQAVEKLRDK